MRMYKELCLKFGIRLTWSYLTCLLSQKHLSDDFISKGSEMSYKLVADSLSLSVQTVTSVSAVLLLHCLRLAFILDSMCFPHNPAHGCHGVTSKILLFIHLTLFAVQKCHWITFKKFW